MLPPVEDAALQNNPDFAALYNTLTTVILNPNGSTKNEPGAKEKDAIREELRAHRLKAAKRNLLTLAISTADPQADAKTQPHPRRAKPQLRSTPSSGIADLPPDLLDLLILLPPLLAPSAPPLSPESTRLLLANPPFSSLPSLVPPLAALVSSALHAWALDLARLANPTTNASYLHRSIPLLPSHAASLLSGASEHKAAATSARLGTLTAVLALQADRTAALAALLRALEAKHGTVARSLELRAASAALDARRREVDAGEALAAAKRAVYTPEVAVALGRYTAHLRGGKARLREEIAVLEEELAAYGVGGAGAEGEGDGDSDDSGDRGDGARGVGGPGRASKERRMREMARVYREMGRQLEEAKGDLERLGKRRGR